jgi:hypothetical protein
MKFGHDRLIPVIMEEEMLNPTNWSDNVRAVFVSTKFFRFDRIANDDRRKIK